MPYTKQEVHEMTTPDEPMDMKPFEDADPDPSELDTMPADPAVDPGPDGDLTLIPEED